MIRPPFAERAKASTARSISHEPLVSYRINRQTLRVDSSSADDSRLRGALPTTD
jgi:hypothetical protein